MDSSLLLSNVCTYDEQIHFVTMSRRFLYIFINLLLHLVYGNIKVGLVLPKNVETGRNYLYYEAWFNYTIHKINHDKETLPTILLAYDIRYTQTNSSYEVHRTVCKMIHEGVQVFFGIEKDLNVYMKSIFDTLDIPFLITSTYPISSHMEDNVINLFPNQQLLHQAFTDAIKSFKWTKVGILSEQHGGILNIESIAKIKNIELFVRLTDASHFRIALKYFKSKDINNLIVDVMDIHVGQVLRDLIHLQMAEPKFHYVFTNFDFGSLMLAELKYNFMNVSYYRLMETTDLYAKVVKKRIEYFNENDMVSKFSSHGADEISTDLALLYDALHIFAIGLQAYSKAYSLDLSPVSCSTENAWKDGLSLINYINSVEWRGLSGPIQFKEGGRQKFKLDLLMLKQHTAVKIGEWSPKSRLVLTQQPSIFHIDTMNATLVVMTIIVTSLDDNCLFSIFHKLFLYFKFFTKEPPYIMMHYSKNITGNNRFYGFCVDLLKEISKLSGFDYILDLVPDRKYGTKDAKTGEWNGLVSQLMKNKVDLAIGPITITYAREQVIDFTKPYMNLGISILLKATREREAPLFSFMKPLTVDVWLYIFAAYCTVSLTMFVLSQFITNQVPSNREISIGVRSNIELINSFWFTLATLMQQNFDFGLKSPAIRIVSAMWWFFTLIIISSYTANLAAFLTVERMSTPVENAEDLVNQNEILYGTLDSGSTMEFFRDAKVETYRKMWKNMNIRRNISLTSTYKEGIKRVNKGNYAFFMESTIIDYIVQRNCNLTQVGGLLDAKGYGIALPKNSIWRDKLSLSILQLQERGDIQLLYNKWWRNAKHNICVKKIYTKKRIANALGWNNIGGAFIILSIGILFAIGVSVMELIIFTINSEKKSMTCIKANQSSFLKDEAFCLINGFQKNKRLRFQRKCVDCL